MDLQLHCYLALTLLLTTNSWAQLTLQQLGNKCQEAGLPIRILPNPQLDHAFSISCIPAGGGTIDKYLWGRESVNDPPINFTEVPPDSHFMQANNRLGFTGVENSDDGLYVCYVKRQGQPTFSERKEAGCIYVLASAKFKFCDSNENNTCTSKPQIVEYGDVVDLDVSLEFIPGGSSNHSQVISTLRLISSLETESGAVDLLCDFQNDDHCTTMNDTVKVMQSEDYNITLRVHTSKPGTYQYKAVYDVEDPRSGGLEGMTKTFQVTVHPEASPSDGSVSSTAPPPMAQTSVYPTGMSSKFPVSVSPTATNNWVPTQTSTKKEDSESVTVVVVAASVVASLALSVIIVVIIVLTLCVKRRHRFGRSSDSSPKDEFIGPSDSTTGDTNKPPNTQFSNDKFVMQKELYSTHHSGSDSDTGFDAGSYISFNEEVELRTASDIVEYVI